MGAERDRESAMSDFAQRVANLSPEARASLERRLKEKSRSAVVEPIPPRRREGPVPLSFAQQHLWILDRLASGVPLYNIPQAFRIRGPLDVEALGRALEAIQQRHEVLRSTYSVDDGNPVQVIEPRRTASLPIVDLGAIAEAAQEAEVLRLVDQEARSPFDLARGPLLRASLFRLGVQEHILLVTVHHIVFDAWSGEIFDRELAALYEAYHEGRPSPLSPLPIQYADFGIWQREWLRGRVLEEQLSYWKRQLEGAPAALELPASRSRPPVPNYRGATETITIAKELTQAIRAVGLREKATLFMTLLAAFKVLLLRHSGQDDVVVGSLVAGRNRSDTEGLIGFFVNTLVFRTDLSGDPTFRESLGRVRDVAIGAYGHQDLPFAKLVEELNPERSLSHSPLFQVMMTLQNTPSGPLRLAGATVTPLRLGTETTKFDLTAAIEDRGEEIGVSFRYSTDLFEASAIRHLLGQFRTLLEGIASDPDRHLSDLPVLTQTERLALSRQTNRVRPTNAFVEFRKEEIEQSITERFKQQVRRHSSRIAVRSGTHSWTYEQLAHEVDRVGRAILEVAGPEPQRIALLFEQDAPMIAAILGSLEAGKTYVPLDPSYPVERLAYMLEDSGASVILTNDQNLALASSLGAGRCSVASLDRLDPGSSGRTPASFNGPESVAYILYTSGSTGRPKGVVQNHRNVLHFIRAYTNGLHIRADDRLSLLASYSFDAAVMDIFGALLNGATLCIWNLKAQGVAGLAEWLAKEKITILHAVPTVFRAFAGTLNARQGFPRVRLVVLGGEEAHRTDVELYREHFPGDCLFVNGLGPTESTVALQYFLDRRTEIHRSTVPVGYPVDETEILLLDAGGRRTELCGEIGIRSPHVALGYWGKPEVTQAAFLPDPDGGTRRIYRTGDLGRLLPDGAIQFLGRKDHQVKIRGHRIELGEIEETLLKHPSLREAVVVLREDTLGDRRLLAYLVRDPRQTARITEIRTFLREKLPDFMIPSSFVWLDSFPLTPNGKIDRTALPSPGHEQPLQERTAITPRNALESKLVRIWERVLDMRPVGVTDNFFDLGGHSLLAVHLFTEIEKATGKTVPLSTIFQAQTVEGMAARLEAENVLSSWSSLMAIRPGGSRPPLFCVHALGANALEYRSLARHLDPDVPVYGLAPQGLDGRLPPHERVEDMAAHYLREIRELQPEGPYYLAGWSFGGRVAFEMARQLQTAGQKVALLALLDSYTMGPWRRRLSRSPSPSRSAKLPAVVRNLGFLWRRLIFHFSAVRRLEPRGRPSYLVRKASSALLWTRQKFRGLVDAVYAYVRDPLPKAVRQVHAANQRAAAEYVPKPYDGCVTLFRAGEWCPTMFDDPFLGWAKLSEGGLDLVEIPGDHHTFILDEENVPALARKLAECLEKAREAEQARFPLPTRPRQELAAAKR
jgi:amino acid adenylation domain-containing protein